MLTKLFIFVSIFIIITSVIFLAFFSKTPRNEPSDTIIPTSPPAKPTIIDRTSVEIDFPIFSGIKVGEDFGKEKEAELKPVSKTDRPEGGIEYTVKGFDPLRNDTVLTKNNKVEFIRINTRFSDNPPLLSDFLKKYGEPERVIAGSNYFGFNVSTYIYSSSGFSYLANPSTDWVYEMQFFEASSVDEYINKYGQDVNPNIEPEKEVFGE